MPAVGHPREIDWGSGDVVLLAMKSTETAGALRELAAVADPRTPIFCVQNGVANEPSALRLFARVYGVHVIFPATHLDPGVVPHRRRQSRGSSTSGRYPSGVDATAEQVTAVLRSATFESVPRADIMRRKYTKLLGNLGNAVDAVCTPGDARKALTARLRDEGVAALEAAGIPFLPFEEDRARRGNILTMKPINGQQRTGSSSWQSLARATGSIEADYLNGEIVLLGRQFGVPTPANELARQLANEAARAGSPPGLLTPEEFLERLDATEADGEAATSEPGVRPRV